MSHLWYYRSGHQTVGPIPPQAIERYIVLGRLDLDDEVRTDASSWMKIGDCPEFESATQLILEANDEKLEKARRFSDERSQERRSGILEKDNDARKQDRRADESEELKELRSQRAGIFEPQKERSWMGYVLVACLIGLVLLAIFFYRPVNPFKIGLPAR